MPASAIFLRYSSTTDASFSPSSLRIASICRRRKYSRCCFCAPDSTSSRIRLRTLQFGQPLLLEPHRQRQPLDDVERFEQLDLLVDVEVRRVAGRVGQRAGAGDRSHELIGMTVLIIGILMIVLPGPAIVFIPLGFVILATEFVWARGWLNKIKEKKRRFSRS